MQDSNELFEKWLQKDAPKKVKVMFAKKGSEITKIDKIRIGLSVV